MSKMLEGRVAIVTGGGRGIGAAVAQAMAEHGAAVLVNDLGTSHSGEGADASPAEEVVQKILAAGGRAAANADSVASFEGATRMVSEARRHFGRLDIVVNVAGILRDRMLHKMSPDDWQGVIDVHLGGHFFMCRAAINLFREQNYGRIINFTSTSGLIGNLGQTNYGAAKLGIVAFTRNLALESQRKGITANAIAPFAWTRMIATIPAKDEAAERRLTNLKRMKPEDIAPVCVYLASEDAAHITGQTFGVRAGELMVFSVPRPLRSVHHQGGWTPEALRDKAMPSLAQAFSPVCASAEVFPYDPLD